MVEVHGPRKRGKGTRRQQRVECGVGHARVEHRAHRTLRGEPRRRARERRRRRLAVFQQVIGNRVRGVPSRFERGVNAARRERGHEARGVADQQHVAGGPRGHGSADRDESPAMPEASRPRHVGDRCDLAHERAQVGAARVPACKPDLRDAVVAGHDPPDVAARELVVEEAVQPVAVDAHAVVLRFDPDEECTIDPEAGVARHARPRSVGADEISCAACAVAGAIRTAEPDVRARPGRFAREPAHERRRIGGEEIVAGRREIERAKRRRVEADPVHAPCQRRRDLPSFRRLLHDEARGVNALAGRPLAIGHQHAQPAARRRTRAREPREPGAADVHVVIHAPQYRAFVPGRERRRGENQRFARISERRRL
jgi:hypothetical protein